MDIINEGMKYVMNTYARFPLALSHGEGMYVYDTDGKKYLDFGAGIAVNSLGHNDKDLVAAVSEQAGKLIHVSNLYWTEPQIKLAKCLAENSCFAKAFFCNSGAEANEGALKLARRYGETSGRYEIIAMINSFHGRTMGAITATGQLKYQKGLNPLLPGIKHVPFNDFAALEDAISDKTCAVLMEPVQGESGIHPADTGYLQKVRTLCDNHDLLLMFDEVQCGVGRLGTLFAYQALGVEPDVVCLAKGLAGGVPIGAMLATAKAADIFHPGDHASTFGGNPLATAAANVVLDKLLGGLLDNVKAQGAYLTAKLKELESQLAIIKEVRGIGLMQGIELDCPAAEVISACIDDGLLLVSAGANVIRFVPPLIVQNEDIDAMIEILCKNLAKA